MSNVGQGEDKIQSLVNSLSYTGNK